VRPDAADVPPAVPPPLKPVFWDVALDAIDTRRHGAFVIERVLEYGNAEAIRWMWATYTPAEITDVVRTSRRLSAPTLSLWSRHLGLGEAESWLSGRPSPQRSWRS